MAGNLVLHEKGWLGPKDVTLHSGEGPIWAVKWQRNYIAWANDRGVRIYDTHWSQRIALIVREDSCPRADLFLCNLLWLSDTTLVIAWADYIRIVKVRDKREKIKKDSDGDSLSNTAPTSINPLSAVGAFVPGVGASSTGQQGTYAEVTNVLQLDCMISGIMPLLTSDPPSLPERDSSTNDTTSDFIILSHLTVDASEESLTGTRTEQRRKASQPLELRIVNVSTGEELSSDVLPVQDYERWECKDYRIVGFFASTLNNSSAVNQDVHNKDSYFVISPKDVVLVQKRDVEDHIAWLCEHMRYEEALRVAERQHLIGILPSPKSGIGLAQIGQNFLDHLVAKGQYDKAAESCSGILGTNTKAWEDWIFTFIQRGHIQTIIPHIPTRKPQLSAMVYEMVLAHFLKNSPAVSFFLSGDRNPFSFSI